VLKALPSTVPRSWTLRGDQDATLRKADERLPRLSHLWLDAGYRGGGQRRGLGTEKTLGWSVDLVERPKKPAPKELLMSWAREWAKEGVAVDWHKLQPPEGFQVLPRRWVVERTFSRIEKNRRMSKDYERLSASGESFICVAMTRLMTRRLTRV
jgi:putative transposase